MKTILLIDDDQQVRTMFSLALHKNGYNVIEAHSGIAGLAMARQHLPDLILSDINMPAMNGLEFVKKLQDVPGMKDVPVVMITTEASESHVVEALSYGAKGYIRKPFTPDQVKEHVLPLVKKI